jgi:hypothetical protein
LAFLTVDTGALREGRGFRTDEKAVCVWLV